MILAIEWGVKPYTLTFVVLQTYCIFMGIKCYKNKLSTWVLSQALIVSMGYLVKTYKEAWTMNCNQCDCATE